MANRAQCHDCGCFEGELHMPDCDMEWCPFCGGQLISCLCSENKKQKLDAKRRVPFILYPNMCAKCGALWPEMFLVSDREWKRHIEKSQRSKLICRPCYDQIKTWIDAG